MQDLRPPGSIILYFLHSSSGSAKEAELKGLVKKFNLMKFAKSLVKHQVLVQLSSLIVSFAKESNIFVRRHS
jgi:hypothetical protein